MSGGSVVLGIAGVAVAATLVSATPAHAGTKFTPRDPDLRPCVSKTEWLTIKRDAENPWRRTAVERFTETTGLTTPFAVPELGPTPALPMAWYSAPGCSSTMEAWFGYSLSDGGRLLVLEWGLNDATV